ncbi:MAG: tRNA (adenosine(37)-N6)-threonylcarbamoyltransferase complex dimerization subunit type 1 TsaB [Sphingomonas sp.]
MRTLVIETATSACSVALIDGKILVGERHEVVGRGHAEQLLPMIASLNGGGQAARILVDCGPGSFTGIRVGVAAARALGFGWGVPVAGFSSLALLAAAGFAARDALDALAVVLEGGHGEVFMQSFSRTPFAPLDVLASRAPEAALAALGERVAIGNAGRFLAPIAPDRDWDVMLPRAADVRLLPLAFTALAATPVYGRAPDAKPMAAL